jgi:hypothetical protein
VGGSTVQGAKKESRYVMCAPKVSRWWKRRHSHQQMFSHKQWDPIQPIGCGIVGLGCHPVWRCRPVHPVIQPFCHPYCHSQSPRHSISSVQSFDQGVATDITPIDTIDQIQFQRQQEEHYTSGAYTRTYNIAQSQNVHQLQQQLE